MDCPAAAQKNRLTTAATLVGEGDEEDSEGWETDYDSDFDPEEQPGIGEIITAEIVSDSSDSDDDVEPVAPPVEMELARDEDLENGSSKAEWQLDSQSPSGMARSSVDW